MRVSIVIPVYNQAKYLDQCIQSALAQTCEDREVIVVDDGSTDESAAIATSYPVTLIWWPKNRGHEFHSGSAARNAGLSLARGEFVLPLDADDWIEPEYLAKTVPLMKGRVGIVSTGMHRFGSMDDIVEVVPRTLEQQLISNLLPVTSLVRRDVMVVAGGYWNYGWEDWDLWLRILEGGWKVDVVNEPLFHHRVSPGGLNEDQTKMREELCIHMRGRHRGFVGF